MARVTAVGADAPAVRPAAGPDPGRNAAIDVVKGLAMLGVMAQHSLTTSQLDAVAADLWIRQAVPVLMVLMGYNAMGSLSRRGATTLRDVWSADYWVGRLWRIGLPFAVAWVIAAALALAGEPGHVGPAALGGVLPVSGPGNYFVTVVFAFTVAIGPLYLAFRRHPVATTVACVAADVGFELISGRLGAFAGETHPYPYEGSLLRYLVAIVAGMWLARLGTLPRRVVVPAAVVGLGYLVLVQLARDDLDFLVPGFGVATNAFAIGWSVLLLLVLLRALPRSSVRSLCWLEELGRASYHVFLAQILWFGVVTERGLDAFVLGAAVSGVIGWLAYRLLPTRPPARAAVASRP